MRSSVGRRFTYSLTHRALLSGGSIFFLLLLILLVLFAVLLSNIRPIVTAIAMAEATDVITIVVNDVVREMLAEGNLGYSQFVTLERDVDGNITALITNMANINILQAMVTNAVVEKAAHIDEMEVCVPLGNLIGGALLSGKGPVVKVKLLSLSNVKTEFRNEFTSAGINQTRHQILMDIDVDLNILMAGYNESDDIIVEVSIAETVIVGQVPGTYAAMK